MMNSEMIFAQARDVLTSSSVFGDLLSPANIETFLTSSLIHPLEQGEVLCHQNTISPSMYLILSGELDISIQSDKETVLLAKRHPGELIGEISAMFMMPHIATVTAAQASVVMEIPAEIFVNMMTSNNDLHNTIMSRSKKRIIETALRHVPVFRELNQTEFDELCYVSSMTTASKGELITREGDNEFCMYVICKGAVRVFTNVNDLDMTIALRRPGEYFGEYSFLTGQPRTASVSALTDLQLVKLEGEAFHSFMEYNEPTESSIKQTATLRKADLDQLREELDEKNIAANRLNRIKSMIKYRL